MLGLFLMIAQKSSYGTPYTFIVSCVSANTAFALVRRQATFSRQAEDGPRWMVTKKVTAGEQAERVSAATQP